MSGGAEKPRWKQDDLIVEDIILETEDFTSGHEPPRPPVRNAWDEENKKKKSARSVMKEILKKSKKGISKAMGNKERPSKMNEKVRERSFNIMEDDYNVMCTIEINHLIQDYDNNIMMMNVTRGGRQHLSKCIASTTLFIFCIHFDCVHEMITIHNSNM